MSGGFSPRPDRRSAPAPGHALRPIDHEQHRRDTLCGLDPDEIALDREDEQQEQRDRFDDHGPSRWAA